MTLTKQFQLWVGGNGRSWRLQCRQLLQELCCKAEEWGDSGKTVEGRGRLFFFFWFGFIDRRFHMLES